LNRILTRYWGSHFKSPRQAANFVVQFEPLTELGWKCHLVLDRLPEDPEWLVGLRNLGIEISCVNRPKGSFDLMCMRTIRKLCLETQCDVFHCDNMHMSPLIGASLARVPVRVWCKRAMNSHYEACREPGWKERLALTSRLSVFLSTKVIAVSSAVAGELIELGLPVEKFHVLNNPRPEMQPILATREETRARFGIPQDAIVLVAIGRVEAVKGWDILTEAFETVATESPRVRLLLVGAEQVKGQESFAASIQTRIAKSGLGDRVHFAGHVSDVKAMLLAGDVFVLPSRSEGCCNALLEALEVGLPCVASKVGNATEVLVDGGGLLVPRNDPRALADALSLLVLDVPARELLASQARIPESVRDRQGHARQMAELYEDLLTASGACRVTHEPIS
jgi:glycosyltransferase involved in cell wall biosynthesis